MTIQRYTIDERCYLVSCDHSIWTPCPDAAQGGEPHGWMGESDDRAGGDFFADAPWTDAADD